VSCFEIANRHASGVQMSRFGYVLGVIGLKCHGLGSHIFKAIVTVTDVVSNLVFWAPQ
jgi:hypothetical protein